MDVFLSLGRPARLFFEPASMSFILKRGNFGWNPPRSAHFFIAVL